MVKDCRWVVGHVCHVSHGSHDSSALFLCVTYPLSILYVATVFFPFLSTEEEQGSNVDAGFDTSLSPSLTPHCSPLTYLLSLFLSHFDTPLYSLMLLSPDSGAPPALTPFSLPFTSLLTLIPHSPDSLTPLSSL